MHMNISGAFSHQSSSLRGFKKSKRQSKPRAFSVHRSMNETGYLMRLASARTPSQVSAVISLARADAKAVNQSSSSSSEIQKAKRIAKSIEKQGLVKSAKLRKENQLEREAQAERAAKKLNRAKSTSSKLAKKRRVRKAQERVAIANSIPIENRHKRHVDEYVDDTTPLSQYSFDNIKMREEAAASAGTEAETSDTTASGSVVDCCI